MDKFKKVCYALVHINVLLIIVFIIKLDWENVFSFSLLTFIAYLFSRSIFKENKENKNLDERYKTTNTKLYEREFIIDECENYERQINDIIEIEKDEIDLYDGMSNSEIREAPYDIGEIDGQETPDVILHLNENKTNTYISVRIYHKGYDKYLMVGKIPFEYQDEIIPLLKNKVLIWGSYSGGTFKTVNDNDKIIKYKKPVKIKILIKIFDK